MNKCILLMAATAFIGAGQAAAQSSSPKPKPTPPLRDPGNGGLKEDGPDSPEFRRETFRMRKENQFEGAFQREWDSRIVLANNGALNKYELAMLVAECVGVQDSNAGRYVGGMMSEDPDFKALQKALKRRYSGCVVRQAVGIPMMLINGALGETLVEKVKPSLDDKVMPADIVAAQNFYLRKEGMTLETLGRCHAVFSPGLIVKVERTKPGSDAEKTAIAQVYARTPECGVPAMPTDIELTDQRAAMAAGLYHWLKPGQARETGGEGFDAMASLNPGAACAPGNERQCVDGRSKPGDQGGTAGTLH